MARLIITIHGVDLQGLMGCTDAGMGVELQLDDAEPNSPAPKKPKKRRSERTVFRSGDRVHTTQRDKRYSIVPGMTGVIVGRNVEKSYGSVRVKLDRSGQTVQIPCSRLDHGGVQ